MSDTITPHKGGRTERFPMRLTPNEKARLKRQLTLAGDSLPDWVMKRVTEAENDTSQ